MKSALILAALTLGCPATEVQDFVAPPETSAEISPVRPLGPRPAPVVVPDAGMPQGSFKTGGCLTGDRSPRLLCRGAGEMAECADGWCKCAPTAPLPPLKSW